MTSDYRRRKIGSLISDILFGALQAPVGEIQPPFPFHRLSQPVFQEDGTMLSGSHPPDVSFSCGGARLGCSPLSKVTCRARGACAYLACAILTRSRECLEARRA